MLISQFLNENKFKRPPLIWPKLSEMERIGFAGIDLEGNVVSSVTYLTKYYTDNRLDVLTKAIEVLIRDAKTADIQRVIFIYKSND